MTSSDASSRFERLARILDYPYLGPRQPYLLSGGKAHYKNIEPGNVTEALASLGRDNIEVTLILSSGSNGGVAQLLRKFPSSDFWCLSLPVTVKGYQVAFSAHVSPYGAIPTTLYRAPRAEARVWLVALPRRFLGDLHRSESKDVNYRYVGLERPKLTPWDAGSRQVCTYESLHGPILDKGRPLLLDEALPEPGAGHTEASLLSMMWRRFGEDVPFSDFLLKLSESRTARERLTAALKSMSVANEPELAARTRPARPKSSNGGR